MTESTIVRHEVTVRATQEAAFAAFTQRFGDWWPREHHIGESDPAEVVMEDRQGGLVYETGTDGARCQWGTVLAWEPPSRLVVAWQINGSWQFEPDLSRCSEYEVRFEPAGDGKVRVALEHRHFERHGEDGPGIAAAVNDAQGWPYVLSHYAALADRT